MIIVVAEEPGTTTATGDRLAALIGVTPDELIAHVAWLNILEHGPVMAERLAALVERAAFPEDVILLLGRRVAAAFRLDRHDPLEVIVRSAGRGPTIALIPHPSPRNRWYNDPDHGDDASIILRRLWSRR